jgi:hypothetical protein
MVNNSLRKISTFFGCILGVIIALFGVFIFNFDEFLTYQGRHIVDLFQEIRTNWDAGLYEISWIGFRFNLFEFFFSEINSEFIISKFLPIFLAWFIAGLVTGLFAISVKRGILFSFLVISLFVILWLCFAVISGANITTVFIGNIFETGGGILTALLSIVLGGVIGGAISGMISVRIENRKIVKDVTSQ